MSQKTNEDSFTSYPRQNKHAAPVSLFTNSMVNPQISSSPEYSPRSKSGTSGSVDHPLNSTTKSQSLEGDQKDSPTQTSLSRSRPSVLGDQVADEKLNKAKSKGDSKARAQEEKVKQWQEDEPNSASDVEENLKVSRKRMSGVDKKSSKLEQPFNSHPDSPKSLSSLRVKDGVENNMPRTSSIDSAISSVSNSSWPQKAANEGKEPTIAEIRGLIATAGSAENLIHHLLKDKNHAAVQNAQLWKLVDKQRALLLGLNKDLERLNKDRDRYRKKVKDLQTHPNTGFNDRERKDSYSPRPRQPAIPFVESETKHTEVPAEDSTPSRQKDSPSSNEMGRSPPEDAAIDPGMIPSPLHLQQQQERHNNTITSIMRHSPDLSTESEDSPEKPSNLTELNTNLPPPSFALTEATPITDKIPKPFPTNRKAPPKPLDLKLSNQESLPQQATVPTNLVDQDLDASGRGRRTTREDDDRERELLVLQEQEARSRSKKEKRSKTESSTRDEATGRSSALNTEKRPFTPPQQISAPDQPIQSVTGQESANNQIDSLISKTLSPPLRSPGLPASPRPVDRQPISGTAVAPKETHQVLNSLPLSPRAVGNTLPLSPRAPKQALPAPTNPTVNVGSSSSHKQTAQSSLSSTNSKSESDRLPPHESKMSTGDIPQIYRGFVNSNRPDLLLPPNALPLIQVKVASSRLRPSRNSIIGFRNQEDSTVFSLSVFSRSNSTELWRIEKIPAALPQLEQQLRPRCKELPKLPERKLFNGHSPAMLDARRAAIDLYFDELLDTPVDEDAALLICRFLSTDVLEAQPERFDHSGQSPKSMGLPISNGLPRKVGYLTKKGKNFGGWKSRYFVLDSPELRYFEAPGGAHLGTIRLLNARIGRQSSNENASNDDVDADSQFRHAFLILEPKRKDSNSHVRHVLCAENDAERDEWVETLLHYIDARTDLDQRPSTSHTQMSDQSTAPSSDLKSLGRSHPHSDVTIESALKSGSPTLAYGLSGSPTPSSASSTAGEALIQENTPALRQMNISGPMHATVIADAGAWGNKPNGQNANKDRDQWKRNLFHFKKSSNEQLQANNHSIEDKNKNAQSPSNKGNSHVRPVFGMPLAEAVQFCPPQDVDVNLPAVVYRCIEYLRFKKAANEEGLFRLSGSNIVIRSLKERFNTEGDVNLVAEDQYYDVHAVASLFKTYLRELPSIILTRDLHIEFLRVLELDEKSQKIIMFNGLVHKLPKVNYSLLRALSQYLLEVVQNSDRNKMSVKNVGIVFSPTLNIPAPVFSLFLTEFEAIFEDQHHPDMATRSTEVNAPGSLTPEDIRSPRHQMFSDLPTPAYDQSKFTQMHGTAHNKSNTGTATGYESDPSRDFGFAPLQPAYETRNYSSVPQQLTNSQLRFPQPQNGSTGPTLRTMVPDNATSAKAKRRESSMLLF